MCKLSIQTLSTYVGEANATKTELVMIVQIPFMIKLLDKHDKFKIFNANYLYKGLSSITKTGEIESP
jgi:hypothetical protein